MNDDPWDLNLAPEEDPRLHYGDQYKLKPLERIYRDRLARENEVRRGN